MPAASQDAKKSWAEQLHLEGTTLRKWQDLVDKAMEPFDGGSWRPVGPPMTPEEVEVHYGARPNIVTLGVNSWDTVVRMMADEKKAAKSSSQHKPEVETPLIYVHGLSMEDEEDEHYPFTLMLGDYFIVAEEKKDKDGSVVEEEYKARVTSIFYSMAGQWRVGVRWMYRDVDTRLAAPVTKPTKKKNGEEDDSLLYVLPVTGRVFDDNRLWLCGSEEDNMRYRFVYATDNISRPCRVFHVPPGADPNAFLQGKVSPPYDPTKDFYYNQFTKCDQLSFEDLWEDTSIFSPFYKTVLEEEGLDGIRRLQGRLSLRDVDKGNTALMQLSRGPEGKKLNHPAVRSLNVMELFSGGAGLSFLAQSDEAVKMRLGWANDIIPDMGATYTCNHPEAFMSTCGLEEYLQLLLKWSGLVGYFLGADFRENPKLQELLQAPPGKRWSRKHMPQGVGCGGGRSLTAVDLATEAARRGQGAREAAQGPLLALLAAEEAGEQPGPELLEQLQKQGLGVTPDTKPLLLKEARHHRRYLEHCSEGQPPEPDWEAIIASLPPMHPLAAAAGPGGGRASSSKAAAAAAGAKGGKKADRASSSGKADGAGNNSKAAGGEAGGGDGCAAEAAALLAACLPPQPTLEEEGEAAAYAKARAKQEARVEEGLRERKQKGWGKVVEVLDVAVLDCAVRVMHGSSKNQNESGLTDYECWLEFLVKHEKQEQPGWVHQALLQDDQAVPMRHFILRMVADKTIPLPGDVHVLTGGPPCQNMSGLNRQAKQEEVLDDPKNRLVKCYLQMIGFLRPNFILMEQVVDVFRKEDALYARYALLRPLQSGYQVRAGICTAGHYGVPQGRRRAIISGALSGMEQLPPMPAATHRCKGFNQPYPQTTQHCQVEFLVTEEDKQAHTDEKAREAAAKARAEPMCVLGDIFGDLPPLDNYFEGDRLDYAGPPTSTYQAYLRRDPPADSLCRLMRALHADAAMSHWKPNLTEGLQALRRLREITAAGGEEALKKHPEIVRKIMAVGEEVLCRKPGGNSANRAKKGGKPGAKQQQQQQAAGKKGAPAAAAAAAAAATAAGGGKAQGARKPKRQEREPSASAAGEAQEAQEDGDEPESDSEESKAEGAKEVDVVEAKNFAGESWRAYVDEVVAAHGGDEIWRLFLEVNAKNLLEKHTFDLGKHRLEQAEQAMAHGPLAGLRDHRALTCNADDYGRMRAVPREEGANFRDMPGVITHADHTCCAGSWHAAQKVDREDEKRVKANVKAWNELPAEKKQKQDAQAYVYRGTDPKSECAGGGMPPKPPKGLHAASGNDKNYRVDFHGHAATGAFRGTSLPGCPSETFWLATGDLVTPRWCVTYKEGKSNGRHGCFGRVTREIVQPTVVTRAEPHNLQVIHPQEDRVLSIRENARCQGFPDYHTFVGLGERSGGSHGKGAATVDVRYTQIGNAVAPPLAAALGRCLLLAAKEEAPLAQPVVEVPDPIYQASMQAAQAEGLDHYSVLHDVPEEAPDVWHKWGGNAKSKRSQRAAVAAAAAAGEEDEGTHATGGGQQQQPSGATGSGAAAAAAAAAASSGGSKPSKKQQPGQKRPAAGDGTAGGSKKQRGRSGGPASATAAAAGGAAAVAAAAAAAAAAAGGSGAAAAAAARSGLPPRAPAGKPPAKKAAAAAPAGAGKSPAAGGSGSRRSSRSAAAAASSAVRRQLAGEARDLGRQASEEEEEEVQGGDPMDVELEGMGAAAGPGGGA